MNIQRLLCIVLFFAVPCWMSAQTFSGFLTAGANPNQIQGDDLAGYNNLGGFAGVGVYNDLSDRWRWSLAIAFTQHGSSASAREIRALRSPYQSIRLNYVEVPVKIHYMDWLSDDEMFYKLEFTAGLSYHRLISSKVTGFDGSDLTDFRPYNGNVLAASLGAYYAWSLKWAAGLVYNRGMTDAQGLAGERFQSLEQLSLRLRRTL